MERLEMIEASLLEYWPLLGAAFGFVLWLGRLESRANTNSKDLAALEKRLANQRREDMEIRARDWGRMEAAISVMAADIKKILERGIK